MLRMAAIVCLALWICQAGSIIDLAYDSDRERHTKATLEQVASRNSIELGPVRT